MADQDSRPNILFLLADDQSYRSAGYNGNPVAKTPNLDVLAAEGVIFDRHYDTSPICMASRAGIATGLYEYRTGCNFEHGQMSPDMFSRSYHILLRNSGYFVGYEGKFGFGVECGGPWPRVDYYHEQENLPGKEFDWWRGLPAQGFYETARNENMAYLSDEYPHLTRALGHTAGEFFDESIAAGKPFCLTVGFKSPHGPLTPDPIFDDVYARTVFPKPENYGEKGAAHLAGHVRTGRQWVFFSNWEGVNFENSYRPYFQLIHGLDYAVGMIRAALNERGLADNTVIIFSSDNGYFCGAHHLGGKVLLYEESSRVPMIIYDPRHPSAGKGIKTGCLSGNIDVAPTILALAGLEPPSDIDGDSLLSLMDIPGSPVRESLSLTNFWNMPPTQGLAVTDGRYKYLYYWYVGEGMQPTEELFDLQADPLEMTNLMRMTGIGDVTERLRKLYDGALTHIREHSFSGNRYGDYGILLDRMKPWAEKEATYKEFFDRWIRTRGSWRGGKWFEDLDLSDYPEDVAYSFGRKPKA